MSDILVLQYAKCTTCKKALAWLRDRGVSYTDRPIVDTPPTQEELRTWWQASGLPLRRFFNTSGMKYRELQLAKKLPEMSEDEQLTLLASDGMLVKRPLLVTQKGVFPGFREEAWVALLGE